MYFIIDGRNNIQHPTKKHDMISRWIKKGKAKFIGKNLVQVFKTFEKSKTINCKFIVGIDPGYKHIGYSIFKIFDNKLQNILNGEVITRTSEITKLMQERKYDCCRITVAWNRQARSGQDPKKPSLLEFKQEYPDEIITVKPGRSVYFKGNKLAKFRPGDIFKTQGKTYVLKSWASTQGYNNSECGNKFKTKDCTKIKNRVGMIII